MDTAKRLHSQYPESRIAVLNIAADNHVDILILGAFGCGAFRNNPSIFARVYKEIIPDYIEYFKFVNFVVYCPSNNQGNYNVFKNTLCQAYVIN